MTLPPNSLPTENPALAGDLLAVLGQNSAGASDTAGQDTAPFSEMLAGASASPAPLQEAASACPPAALLYSTHSYTTVLQPAETEEVASLPEEENLAADPAPTAETEADAALVIAYEFVAGQWVQQPPTQPKPAEQPTPDVPSGTTGPVAANPDAPASAGALPLPADAEAQAAVKDTATSANAPATSPQPLDPATQKKPSDAAKKPAPSDTVAASSGAKPGAADTSAATRIDPQTPPPAQPLVAAPAHLRTAAGGRPEKFAAPASGPASEIASGVNSPNSSAEKKTLVAESKAVKSTARSVGMAAANRESSMPYSAVNKSSAPAHAALPQPLATGGIQTSATAPAAEISASSAAQAPRLVQEIHAIAERISSIDRNTVEVRFDFNETDRLSVRVEYRDGTVHTTFRTDSGTLRDAIAREWIAQAGSAEPRAYRVAEPAFSTNSDRPLSADLSQSGHGSGQSHSRAFDQHAPSAPQSHFQSGRSHGSSGAERQPAAFVRPETSHHLHTFA